MAYIGSFPRLGDVDLSTIVQPGNPGTPFSAGSNLPAVTLESQLGEIICGYDANLGGGEFMYVKAATTIVAAQTISSITISGNTATLTTGSAHGLTLGANSITVVGAVPAGYNGTFQVVTVPTTTTLTYTIPNPSSTVGSQVPLISATTVGTYTAGIGAGAVCELAYSLVNGYLTLTATPWTGTAVSGKPLGIALANIPATYYGYLQVQGAAVTVFNGTATVGNPVSWQANGTVSNSIVASKSMLNATAASVVSATINQGNAAVVLPAYQALVFVDRPFSQGPIT